MDTSWRKIWKNKTYHKRTEKNLVCEKVYTNTIKVKMLSHLKNIPILNKKNLSIDEFVGPCQLAESYQKLKSMIA